MKLIFEPTRTAGICRGDKIQERASGFTGVCTAISISEEGSQMVGIQPRVADDKLPEVLWFDEKACIVLDTELREFFTYAEDYLGFEFGSSIQDTRSKRVGTLTEAVLYQNGCIKVLLVPESDGGANDPQAAWIGQHRITVVESKPKPLKSKNKLGGAPTRDKPISNAR